MVFQNHALARLGKISGAVIPPGHLESNLRKRWLSVHKEKIQNLKRFRKRQRRQDDGRRTYGSCGRLGGGGFAGQADKNGEASQALTTRQLSSFIAKGTESLSAALVAETASVAGAMVADNSEGFSEVELTAILDNLETAGPEDVENILGLSIQSNDVGTQFEDMHLNHADLWV